MAAEEAVFLDYKKNTCNYKGYRHAAHALIYCKMAPSNEKMKHAVMMQLRFDGTLGFPGGFVDGGENLENGLNRELYEEIGLTQANHFTETDYFGSWYHEHIRLMDHFYVKKLTENDFVKLENRTLECHDWGGETMGIIRVPLQKSSKNPNFYSLSQFFQHNFIGNAKHQLIQVLVEKNILPAVDVQDASVNLINNV
nr:U8 snoRNA-decapping enzyme-like [Ciona intestinalis]|eukprot:XP_002125879.2 U8 snoRNA-decapping enzyme-like [Ciona intestinalis]